MENHKELLLNIFIFGVIAIGGFILIGNKVLKTSGAK
jgi:hypothetical protein